MRISINRRLFVALLVAAIAGLIFRISYFQESAEAYLFPSIVAIAMLGLALLSLFREAVDLCVDDFQAFPFVRQVPAIVMMVAGVALVEILGMYSSAFLVLFLVSYWYSPQEDGRRRLLNSLVFSVGFAGFMYLLFTVMLNVQLPRGLMI